MMKSMSALAAAQKGESKGILHARLPQVQRAGAKLTLRAGVAVAPGQMCGPTTRRVWVHECQVRLWSAPT